MEPLVNDSLSFAEVIKKLGLKLTGGNYRYIKFRIDFLKLNVSHFKGRGWAKGLSEKDHPSIKKNNDRLRRSDKEIFLKNSPENNGTRIRKRLVKLGWEYKCSCCGLSEWQNKEISLQVDHKNGDNRDNRLVNLRFLCPNCHTQTKTFGARNISSYDRIK